MGYNGGINKRGYYRRNHGMYKKSSYRTGERLLGNIFSGGIGLLSLLADTGDARKSISYSKSSKSDLYIPKISTIDDSIINKITTKNYAELKENYESIIKNNKIIKQQIKELKIKKFKYKILKLLFYCVPSYRNIYDNKVKYYTSLILEKKQSIFNPLIDVIKLLNNNVYPTLENRGKISVAFENIKDESFIEEQSLLKISEDKSNFFNYNGNAISCLKSNLLQIHLFHNGIILMTKDTFAIVDYNNITSRFEIIHMKTFTTESDVNVISNTWIHTKADGDRDMRYKENYEVNLVEYACLRLEFREDFIINILFSDILYGKKIAELFNVSILNIDKKVVKPKKKSNREERNNSNKNKQVPISYKKAVLTPPEEKLCELLKQYGKPLNQRIAYKKPQIGSSVKRLSDNAVLQVINVSADKFKCFDFEKKECYIYTREELLLA